MKQIGIKLNGGLETVYAVPTTLTFQIGDSLEVRAIVTGTERFAGFSEWLTGTTNPQTKIVDSIATITIGVNTISPFDVIISNSEFIDNKNLEYDIIIKAQTDTFVLGSYQVSLDLDALVVGTLTNSYKAGSSELTNIPSVGFGTVGREIGFAAGALGSDTITTTPKKIGRFILTSTEDLPFTKIGMAFDFDGAHNTIIVDGAGNDVTTLGVFTNLEEKHRVKITVN